MSSPMPEADLWKQEKVSDIVVQHSNYMKDGCPQCGEQIGYEMISGHGASLWKCSSCRLIYVRKPHHAETALVIVNDGMPNPFRIRDDQVEFNHQL